MITTHIAPRIQKVRFARKAENLSWVQRELRDLDVPAEFARVVEVKELTSCEYDAFAKQLLRDRDWLYNFHGMYTDALEIRSANRPTLYIRTEGYRYARYVGLAADEG
ncbi:MULTISPECIES: hypothetical protein [unclassified Lysobacter]|uniref:hypothetical protein n=1 Tax=unclassified Lysobacter TaxID=2635362 RepID=UPI001BEB94D3|nr:MULTISPECIES: hypothetical protein [unclassified Lysobacter]MBT2748364.1 hypothetical protein [Lysobacter sp. ISL-42]MBT2749869.1 hypothetical protein [Lysobacter sp. ISL-50]MBT2781197.1 hypothetical protein [Lysobacter sp. ISL-52]